MALEHPFLTLKNTQMGLKATKPNMKEMLKHRLEKKKEKKDEDHRDPCKDSNLNVNFSPGGREASLCRARATLIFPARGPHFMSNLVAYSSKHGSRRRSKQNALAHASSAASSLTFVSLRVMQRSDFIRRHGSHSNSKSQILKKKKG